MPQLPSGRYVDILPERARYHARRLKLRVNERTSHLQLYPLVDILIDVTNNSHGCRGCTTFSGHTLGDRKWINEWSPEDRRFFLNWLQEESQVRIIEQARVRLLANRAVHKEELHDYPNSLYSILRNRISALPMMRATADQWRRTLLNMKRDGIRREELDWSGAMEFLSQQTQHDFITKEALLNAINFSHILPQLSNELECEGESHLPFREVAQRIPGFQLQMAGYQVNEEDIGVVRYHCNQPNYRVGTIRLQGRSLAVGNAPCWFALGPYSMVISDPESTTPLFVSSDAALQAAECHARKSHYLRPELTYSKSYEYMTLHGGDAYREWLVTLPDYHHSHFTAHYHERNVLLHIRTKVRETEAGSRVLFIEELQSDWQQAVARHGLGSGIPLAPFRKEWASLAMKLMLMHAVKSGLDGIAWADSAVHALRYDRAMSALERIYDHQLPRILKRLTKPWQVDIEQAEFKTRSPWLHAARCNECWKVEGGSGKFSTRPRYDKQQAMALIERHSKALTMSLPMLRIPDAMRTHIEKYGLPLFGEQLQQNTKPE